MGTIYSMKTSKELARAYSQATILSTGAGTTTKKLEAVK